MTIGLQFTRSATAASLACLFAMSGLGCGGPRYGFSTQAGAATPEAREKWRGLRFRIAAVTIEGQVVSSTQETAAAAIQYVSATVAALGAIVVTDEADFEVSISLNKTGVVLDFGSGVLIDAGCLDTAANIDPMARRCYDSSLLNSMVASTALEEARMRVATGRGGAKQERAAAHSVADGRSGAGSIAPGSPQPTAFALVVGIEKYRDVPAAQGASADVARYSALVGTTLGIPEENVHVIADDRASKGDIEKELRWLKQSVPVGGRAYFFYSGHGAPDTATGVPYLVPYDGDPKALADTAIPLSAVMAALQATKGKDALAVVDACFSGSGGRSVLPAGARPLVAVKDARPTAKLALFTASTGAQISGPAPDGTGGLFSSVIAEGLGSAQADVNGDGQVSLAELSQWVKPRVQREAKKDRRDQTPGLVLGAGAGRAEDFVVAYGVKR